jgi:hypothetical protein
MIPSERSIAAPIAMLLSRDRCGCHIIDERYSFSVSRALPLWALRASSPTCRYTCCVISYIPPSGIIDSISLGLKYEGSMKR